jgi:hypothetical protein
MYLSYIAYAIRLQVVAGHSSMVAAMQRITYGPRSDRKGRIEYSFHYSWGSRSVLPLSF